MRKFLQVLVIIAIIIIAIAITLYYSYHSLFCLYWSGSFKSTNNIVEQNSPHNIYKNKSNKPKTTEKTNNNNSNNANSNDNNNNSNNSNNGNNNSNNNITNTNSKIISDIPIPKTIHQIWIGPKQPPMQWISTVQNFARYNNYGYKLWRDQDIFNLDLINKTAYDAELSWAGKADIARYEILYRYGGIYVDADSMVINEYRLDLDKVFHRIRTDSFAVYEKIGSCLIANGIIGSIPGSQMMYKLIDWIHRTYKYFRFFRIPAFISTGPYALSHIYYMNDNSRLMTVLPSNYFYPVHWHGVNQKQSKPEIEKKYPNAYMYQFGYTTNNH